MPDDFEQLSLFDDDPGPDLPPRSVDDTPASSTGLSPDSPFEEALEVYLVALKLSGASPHTIKAFKSDLNLLGRWAGTDTPIGDFSTAKLNQFLHWMLTERDKPCSPKTYARRVTTLKNFFSYLYEERAIPEDPSTAVIQRPVSSPLPDVLLDDERERALDVTRTMRNHPESPDARPHFLLTLLLKTGIKKSECMALSPADFVRDHPDAPHLWVRYQNPRMRYKERKIAIDADLLIVLDEYLRQRRPEGDVVFDCTARNLEYVLRDVSELAEVERTKLSFETLRWTCALTDYVSGMDPDDLRRKLGLSRVSWRDTSDRLAQLAEQHTDAVAPRDLDQQIIAG